jgi:hypothetical protein
MQACGAPSKQLRAGGSNQQHQHGQGRRAS